MSSEPKKIIDAIKKKEFPPYIVIHGEDEMLVNEAAKKIAATILPPEEREFNYDVLDGKELDFADLFSRAHTYPFLQSRRLIVVKEAVFFAPQKKDAVRLTPDAKKRFSDTKEVESILKEEPPDFSTIIFTASFIIKKSDPLLKLILKQGKEIALITAKKFDPMTDKTFLLAQEKLTAAGKKIELGAYELLKEKCGKNSRLIFDELEKITTYMDDSPFITRELVEELVTDVSEENIFTFLEQVTSKNLELALKGLQRLKNGNARPEIILFMFVQQFRWLNQLKTMKEEGAFASFKRFDYFSFQKSIIPALKERYADVLPKERRHNVLLQHPFAVMKSYQASLKFKLTEIRGIMENLEGIDIGMKTSSLKPWFRLENLILMICGAPHVV